MKKLLEKLLISVNELIENTEDTRSNLLRYQIGKTITDFYISHKEELKKGEKSTDLEIIDKTDASTLNIKGNNSEKSKISSSWEKIKIDLSKELINNYDGDGYSTTNLGYMQQFYKKYRNSPESLEKALLLEWSHNVSLLKDRLNDDERKFYLKKALAEKWTVKELEKQIRNESYDVFLRTIEECAYNFKIDTVKINNYKSLVDFNINNPSQFLVFA